MLSGNAQAKGKTVGAFVNMTSRAGTAGLLLAAGMALPAAAGQPLQIAPGLWEITTSSESSGAWQPTEEQLSRLTPEQQTKVRAALKAMQEKARQPHVFKECITAEQISKGLKMAPDQPNCTRTIVSSSATLLVVHEECRGEAARRMDTRFEAPDPGTLHGTVDMSMTRGPRTMTARGIVTGKRLAADCPAAAPNRAE